MKQRCSKYFLINLSYLGFRYHGVQKVEGLPTIASQIESVIASKIVTKFSFKFSSRTDAMVSSNDSYLLLIFEEEISFSLLSEALRRLPQDIFIKSLRIVDKKFNLLNSIHSKTYHYNFIVNCSEPAPFWSSTMTHFKENLDIEKMQIAAKVFEGEHSFRNLSYKVDLDKNAMRTIFKCELLRQELGKGNIFHPETRYYLIVHGDGFLRAQVRMMMGALIQIGKGELSVERLSNEILKDDKLLDYPKFMVPPTGLMLFKTHLK